MKNFLVSLKYFFRAIQRSSEDQSFICTFEFFKQNMDWSSNICDCYKDWGTGKHNFFFCHASALMTFFCPCVTLAKNHAMFDNREAKCMDYTCSALVQFLIYLTLQSFLSIVLTLNVYPLLAEEYQFRQHIRVKYGLQVRS